MTSLESPPPRNTRSVMDSTDVARSPKSGTIEPTIVTFAVSDPEVLLALSEYPDGPARTNFLVDRTEGRVLSLKAARGTLDSDTLRREGDRVMEELGTRLNNWRSKFEERVSGSLDPLLRPPAGHVHGAGSSAHQGRWRSRDRRAAAGARSAVEPLQGVRAVHRREQPALSDARSDGRQPAGRDLAANARRRGAGAERRRSSVSSAWTTRTVRWSGSSAS